MYICRLAKPKVMENMETQTCKLLYNTERVKLYIPEYGRNVQKMVDYLKTIEDREKRNEQAKAVIKVMEILNPAVHLQDNYEQKLWDHLYIISGFDLDVDSPYPMPAPESLHEKPRMVPIQKKPVKAAHYGRNIENVIDLIAEQQDEEVRTSMIRSLGIYMKQQYLTWNKDTVSDETILKDMELLSEGRLSIPEGIQLGKVDNSAGHVRAGNGNGQGKQGNRNHRQKNNQID